MQRIFQASEDIRLYPIKVSEELLNDSAFDLMSYLSDEFGRRLSNAEEQAFLTGTGTGQPTGILTDTMVLQPDPQLLRPIR